MKNLKISTKLVLGFGVMVLLMLGTLGAIKLKVDDQNATTSRTVDLRAPTIQNSLSMLNGINLSLAGLRGWMLLGDPKFQGDRAQAWQGINESTDKMTALSLRWTDPTNVERFEELKGVLSEFRSAQQEIDEIANTPENLPATQILLTDAAPRAQIIIDAITTMIDLELARPASNENRTKILGSMANLRGSLAMSLANIRAYLLSGDSTFIDDYDRFTVIRQRSQRELEGFESLLGPAQRAAFDTLTTTIEEFEPLPPRMFEIRGGKEWNVANYKLAHDAAPKATRIVALVEGMVESQTGLIETDKQEVAKSIETTNLIMVVLLGTSLVLALVISVGITSSIAGPVVEMTNVATRLSLGDDINEPLAIDSGGEVGELAKALERLRASVVALTEIASDGMGDDIDL